MAFNHRNFIISPSAQKWQTAKIEVPCVVYIFKFYQLIGTKVLPNQLWQDQVDAHSLITLARSTVLPYLIWLYFKYLKLHPCKQAQTDII